MAIRHIPAPQAQAFVACRKITNDPQTGEIVIVGPVGHVPVTDFPAVIRLAIYAHVKGGHGTYPIAFILRAADGDTVWRKDAVNPLHHPDPLMAGGEEIGRQPMIFGTREMLGECGWTELMPIVDRLETQLEPQQNGRRQLLEALLHWALEGVG